MTAVTRQATMIERRFHGPSQTGHGCYSCGRLARERRGAGHVSLCSPPPLERPLTTERAEDDERLLLLDGETILADAQGIMLELDPPPHIELAAAQAASSRCLGFAHHPLPTCFPSGPNRTER